MSKVVIAWKIWTKDQIEVKTILNWTKCRVKQDFVIYQNWLSLDGIKENLFLKEINGFMLNVTD